MSHIQRDTTCFLKLCCSSFQMPSCEIHFINHVAHKFDRRDLHPWYILICLAFVEERNHFSFEIHNSKFSLFLGYKESLTESKPSHKHQAKCSIFFQIHVFSQSKVLCTHVGISALCILHLSLKRNIALLYLCHCK